MSAICPGCGNAKSKRAELCGECRRTANQIGASVVTHVASLATPATPVIPRTPVQNTVYHGRLREIALLENPALKSAELYAAERELKKWSVKQAARMVKRPLASSTELSELEMERLLEWLADVIERMKSGGARPR